MIEHIKQAIENAYRGKSKLSERSISAEGILAMEGMSGKGTRHLYNNLLNLPNVTYLEVGCWKGSSTCSALFKNDVKATVIDNFGQWGDVSKEFSENISAAGVKGKINLILSDCWEVDVTKLPKFSIYLFDGAHEEEQHFKALDYYKDCLEDEFIYVVDDYSWAEVKAGTERALSQFEILYRTSIEDDTNQKGFWNGVGIFLLRKCK